MLVHRRVTPSIKFAGTHLYTWVKRGTVRVKCLAQEHNKMTRPGIEHGPLDPEFSTITVRPPRLPDSDVVVFYFIHIRIFDIFFAICCPTVIFETCSLFHKAIFNVAQTSFNAFKQRSYQTD